MHPGVYACSKNGRLEEAEKLLLFARKIGVRAGEVLLLNLGVRLNISP